MKSGLVPLALLPLVALAQPTTPVPPADPLEALAGDSPFLPAKGGGRPGAATSAGPLELRGIVFVDGTYRFSIYDQGTNEANWVGLDERGHPFVARSFNRERDTLTVEHQGRTVTLALQPARMAASGHQPPPSPSPLPGPGGPNHPDNRRNPTTPPPNAPGAAPAASAPNAAEAQRLQNLADEIRRRRGTGASRINLPSAQPTPPGKN